MDECVEILENSPDAAPSDKTLIHLVKLAHLTEEVGFQFSIDDPGSSVSFSDPKVQYTLKAFEKQLVQWKRELPAESYSRKSSAPLQTLADRTAFMRQSEHILNIYMHETAMQLDASPTDEEPSGPTTASHINALTSCLTSIQQALDAICSVDIRTVVCLPTVALARTSYAAIALIKLYSLTSAPDSKIGQVIDPASLKVEYYLDKVINHYSVAGKLNGGRAPAKFSIVLGLLRSWFAKQKDQSPVLREALGGLSRPITCADENDGRDEPVGTSSLCRQQLIPQAKMTTPLHLLSEVAMGDPSRPNTALQSRAYPADSSDIPNIPAEESENWMQQSQYPPVPGLPAPSTTAHSQPRPYYQPYNQGYPEMPPGTAPSYPSNPVPSQAEMLMPTAANQTCFVPELGMQVGLYPENLFALGNMLDEGFFNLPFGGAEDGFYT